MTVIKLDFAHFHKRNHRCVCMACNYQNNYNMSPFYRTLPNKTIFRCFLVQVNRFRAKNGQSGV